MAWFRRSSSASPSPSASDSSAAPDDNPYRTRPLSEQVKDETAKPNGLDRLLAAVNPVWGVERAVAREKLRQFGWDGARKTTERGSARGFDNQNPETIRLQRDRIQLMWESREMYRQSPLFRGTVDRLVRYIIGRLAYKSRTGDAGIDRKIEDYFHAWCKRSDWTERFTLRKQVELALRGMILDGDHLLLPLRDLEEDKETKQMVGSGEVRLQNVEGDRIGDPSRLGVNDGRPHGLFLKSRGRIDRFELFKVDHNNRYEKDQEVEKSKALFLVDPFRSTMYRGVPLLATAIPRVRDLYEAIKLEMAAAKFQSAHAGFLVEGAGGMDGVDWDTSETKGKAADLPNTYEALPGRLQRVRGGGDIKFPPASNRPSGAFMALMEVLGREFANAGDMPYGFAVKLGDLGGVSQRVEVMQAQRLFEYYRSLLEDQVLNPIRDLVLQAALVEKKIPYHAKYLQGAWMWGAHLTADVGHDTSARLSLLQAGLTTRTREAGYLHGEDYSALLDEGTAEVVMQKEKASETGIPVEMMPGGHEMATQLLAGSAEGRAIDEGAGSPALPSEAGAVPAEQAAMPAEPKGLVGQMGAKEMKAMLDVVKAYNRQEVTREQAVTMLVSQYGVDLAEAEELIGWGGEA
jgi:capsid protein